MNRALNDLGMELKDLERAVQRKKDDIVIELMTDIESAMSMGLVKVDFAKIKHYADINHSNISIDNMKKVVKASKY